MHLSDGEHIRKDHQSSWVPGIQGMGTLSLAEIGFFFHDHHRPFPAPSYSFITYLLTDSFLGGKCATKTRGTLRTPSGRSRYIRGMGDEPDQTKGQIPKVVKEEWETDRSCGDKEVGYQGILRHDEDGSCTTDRSQEIDSSTEVVPVSQRREDGPDEVFNSQAGSSGKAVLQSGRSESSLENCEEDGKTGVSSGISESRHGSKEHRSMEIEMETHRSKRESDGDHREEQGKRERDPKESEREPARVEGRTNGEIRKVRLRLREGSSEEQRCRARRSRKATGHFDGLVKQDPRQSRSVNKRRLSCRKEKIRKGLVQSYWVRDKVCKSILRSFRSERDVEISTTRRVRSERKDRSVGRDAGESALSGERKRNSKNFCENEGGSGGGEKTGKCATKPSPLTPPGPIANQSAPDGI